MNKNKIVMATIVIVLIIILGLWISGIIPNQINSRYFLKRQ